MERITGELVSRMVAANKIFYILNSNALQTSMVTI